MAAATKFLLDSLRISHLAMESPEVVQAPPATEVPMDVLMEICSSYQDSVYLALYTPATDFVPATDV